MSIHVNVDNFVRAETDRMFGDIQQQAGGINQFRHNREPASIEEQTVIRMNRDTLYSFAIVNVTAGATLTLPDAGDRYLSAMVVNNDHLVTAIHHEPGSHLLDEASVGTTFALVAVRTLVDPAEPTDIAAVGALQDRIAIDVTAPQAFQRPDYDLASLDTTRDHLLGLALGLRDFDRMFGTREHVDPVHHLLGTAAGWGGLPTTEAAYVGVDPGEVSGDYQLTLTDVPVDAFWSISVYNARGFFEKNSYDRYTVNSVTAIPDSDGSVTVRFVAGEPTSPNSIPVPPGWNYLVRLYRPRPSFFDRSWRLPAAEPVPAS
ncbi:MAG TPA: DUF1214 domain-containing protein [Microlunatus sp.]